MTPGEYLNVLNKETKEKLIGLCLGKKIRDSLEDNCFTNYEDFEEIERNADNQKTLLLILLLFLELIFSSLLIKVINFISFHF